MYKSNVINMLNLFNTPNMWQDKEIYLEIKTVISKLSNSVFELSERDLFLVQELTQGLLESTLSTFERAETIDKPELVKCLDDLTIFQSFLYSKTIHH